MKRKALAPVELVVRPSTGGGGNASTGGGSVVWLGAHPDDELYVAPWLAQLCIEEQASCRFLVMTHGEAGGCKLAQGCLPDLETVRQAELTASAMLFGAGVQLWDFGDGTSGTPDGVAANWGNSVGGVDALVSMVANELEGVDRVVTFDPRHGDSCHADHRAAGAVAIAAAELAGILPSQITLVTSRTDHRTGCAGGCICMVVRRQRAPIENGTTGMEYARRRLVSPRQSICSR